MGKLHRFLLALMLALVGLTLAKPAFAQSFPKPPDVPAYVEVTPTYAAGTTLNVTGDGSTTGGLAPALAYEPTEVAPVTESGWTVGAAEQCLSGDDGPGGLCPEAKFRTRISGDIKILYDDPIRNYGQPGSSHCHMFFGNMSANAYSTYATLRTHARKRSWAAGGPLNGTAYWAPCLIKEDPFGDGKDYALKPSDTIIIYYTNSPNASMKMSRLPLGLRYVGAYDMDNGGSWLTSIIATANAQSGTAGRYRMCQSSSPAHQWSANGNCSVYFSWRCVANDGSGEIWAEGFKNADNSDPFAGKCTAGQDFWVQFQGPSCWDGRNYWSPGGYKHVIPKIWDTVASNWTCPTGWYHLPELAFQIHFAHQGFADYGTWKLSSDASAGTLPGRSFHTDWFNAWDRTALTTWLSYCIAIGTEGNTQPHECDGSTISPTQQLITTQTGTPTGRTPQTGTFNPGYTTAPAGMFELPTSQAGPTTICVGCTAANDPANDNLYAENDNGNPFAVEREWQMAGGQD